MSLRVVVTDIETGESDSAVVADGDYILITADPCYRAGVVVTQDGATHTVTIKGRTIPTPPPDAEVAG